MKINYCIGKKKIGRLDFGLRKFVKSSNEHTFDHAPRAIDGLPPSGPDHPGLGPVDERLHRSDVLSQQLAESRSVRIAESKVGAEPS